MASFPVLFEPRMKPNIPGKINAGRTVVISFGFFTVLLCWSYFNLKVPLILEELLPPVPGRDILKGSIMAIDNFLAVFLQPVIGSLSDRTRSRFGRRIPFIVVGTAFSVFFLVMIPLVRVLAGLTAIIFLFDMAMALYRTPSLVILADYTEDSQRARGSAIQQFISNMGGVIGFAIPMIVRLLPVKEHLFDIFGFALCGGLMLIAMLLQMVFIRETPTGEGAFAVSDRDISLDSVTFRASYKEAGQKEEFRLWASLKELFTTNKNMVYFLIAVTFWYLGFASVEAFFSSFAVSFLGKANDAEAGRLFLAYSVPMILSAYFVGLVGQKIGRKKALVFFLCWMTLSLAVMSFIIVPANYKNSRDLVIMLMLALVSVPWMGVIVNSFPLLWGLAPEDKTGMYTGVYYTFNQSAYMLSPVLMGAVLSLASGMGDYRYIVMFPYVLICLVLGLVFTLKIREKGTLKR